MSGRQFKVGKNPACRRAINRMLARENPIQTRVGEGKSQCRLLLEKYCDNTNISKMPTIIAAKNTTLAMGPCLIKFDTEGALPSIRDSRYSGKMKT
jgi:hypothetical protein